MADEMDSLLNNLNESFGKANVNENGGFELPDGEYLFIITSAEICKSKSSDRIHVKLALKIADGAYVGVPHYSYDIRFTDSEGVADLRAIGFAKLACQKLGLGMPNSMDDFRDAVSKFPERVFLGNVRTSNGFTNTNIVRLIHENHTQWVAEGCPGAGKSTTKKDTGW